MITKCFRKQSLCEKKHMFSDLKGMCCWKLIFCVMKLSIQALMAHHNTHALRGDYSWPQYLFETFESHFAWRHLIVLWRLQNQQNHHDRCSGYAKREWTLITGVCSRTIDLQQMSFWYRGPFRGRPITKGRQTSQVQCLTIWHRKHYNAQRTLRTISHC